MDTEEKIAQLLSSEIPREFLLSFERFCHQSLEDALGIGSKAAKGHRASVTGINRHYSLNQALMFAFEECGLIHNPLRGNAVMVGKAGIVSIGRLHMNYGKWNNSARSKTKRQLCEKNRNIASQVQPDIFDPVNSTITALTCFFVTQGDGSLENPAQIYIVVPDENMDLSNPVFKQSLNIFMQQYEKIQEVPDTVQPILKDGVKRITNDQDEDQS